MSEKTQGLSSLPRIGSSKGSGSSTPPRPPSNAMYAMERARLLFGQYRAGDANDPETYVASVAAVLAEYPMETIRYVTDPRTGIAANPLKDPETGKVWTGMPDLANVKRACEIHYAPTKRALEWEAHERRAAAERRQIEAEREGPRLTYDQIKAKFADVGIHIGPKARQPFDAGAFRKRHGITQEQWDSIPDASNPT